MTLEEDRTYYLRENVTGAESEKCRFRCRFGEREAEFFFDVKDADLISPFQEDNEDIWQGDAVEVFLSPDGDLTRYYELEVSPFGVRFWGEVTFSGGEKALKKLPPPFAAEVMCTKDGYSVHIRLPLSALKGFDRSAMKLNAFCPDRRTDGGQELYALNPTRCDTFHKPQYFLKIRTEKAISPRVAGGKNRNFCR